MTVVTISASFGAGGSVVAPAVAARLGVPFVDRAIPAMVAAKIGCSLEVVLAHDDRAEQGIGRLLASVARVPNVALGSFDVGLTDPRHGFVDENDLVVETERVIHQIAAGQGGVILGRAAAIVLAGHPGALHVRLDGPASRRAAQAARLRGLDGSAAARALADNDRARRAYVRHFYRKDPAQADLYHLLMDSTVIPLTDCAELIVTAARACGSMPKVGP